MFLPFCPRLHKLNGPRCNACFQRWDAGNCKGSPSPCNTVSNSRSQTEPEQPAFHGGKGYNACHGNRTIPSSRSGIKPEARNRQTFQCSTNLTSPFDGLSRHSPEYYNMKIVWMSAHRTAPWIPHPLR